MRAPPGNSVRAATLAAVLLLAVFAHGACADHGFVYDDHRFIVHNPAIRTLAHPERFLDPATASAASGVEPDVWRPLRTLLFAVDHALFSLSPRGWHVVSLLVHLLNAALVFRLLLRLTAPGASAPVGPSASLPVAALGAALFAVHPVTVEAVAWVSSRGDLVASTFALVALLASTRPGPRATVAVVACGALALLAKESALSLFALVPLLRCALPLDARPGRAATALRAGLLLAASGSYLAVRAAVLPTPSDLTPFAQIAHPDGSVSASLRAFLAAVTGYAGSLLVPVGFPFDRNAVTHPPPPSFLHPEVVGGAGILAGLLCAAALGLRRPRSLAPFCAGGTLAVLVPVSGILVPLKAFSADRFLYPALPGLALAAVVGLARAGRLLPAGAARRVAPLVAAGLAVVVCLPLTRARTAPWRDEASLWEAVRRHDPMNPRAYEGLGFELLRTVHLAADPSLARGDPQRLTAVRDHLDRGQRALRTYQEFQPYDGKVRAQNVAALRRLYDELIAAAGASAESVVQDVRVPQWVLTTTIAEARAALEAWDRHGLSRARGDEALRRATLRAWREAALDLGDLGEVLRTNDLLAEADRRDTGAVGYEQRRVPALVAALALRKDPREEARSPGEREAPRDAARDLARRRVRADALGRLGIDPAEADLDAWEGVVGHLSALLEEQPRDGAVRRHRVTANLLRVDLQRPDTARGTLAQLEDDLRILVAGAPGDARLAATLEAVRRRREGR